jgi:hypothetical protein
MSICVVCEAYWWFYIVVVCGVIFGICYSVCLLLVRG